MQTRDGTHKINHLIDKTRGDALRGRTMWDGSAGARGGERSGWTMWESEAEKRSGGQAKAEKRSEKRSGQSGASKTRQRLGASGVIGFRATKAGRKNDDKRMKCASIVQNLCKICAYIVQGLFFTCANCVQNMFLYCA